VQLDPEYNDFILLASKVYGANASDADLLLKVAEETGKVAEAYSLYNGSNPTKPRTGHMVPVVQELADVVCTALVAIAHLGFNPQDLLEWQMNKVKAKHPGVWEVQ
jgi:phosphoribosyl-ATP pyrophosphohydrolase